MYVDADNNFCVTTSLIIDPDMFISDVEVGLPFDSAGSLSLNFVANTGDS